MSREVRQQMLERKLEELARLRAEAKEKGIKLAVSKKEFLRDLAFIMNAAKYLPHRSRSMSVKMLRQEWVTLGLMRRQTLSTRLSRYWRQGLLNRQMIGREFYYKFTRKGLDRLEYLEIHT